MIKEENHPFLREIKKMGDLNEFFDSVKVLSTVTMPFLLNYKNRDELLETFLKRYIHQFKSISSIYYYPKQKINISSISKYNSIVDLGVEIYLLDDPTFILEMSNLCCLGFNQPIFLKSNGTLDKLKIKLKIRKNIQNIIS